MSSSSIIDKLQPEDDNKALMDAIYRQQRYIYDATRKYYLLGRDRLISGLDPGPNSEILELGCGTGRNLVQAARLYPNNRFTGLDLSTEMLKSAAKAVDKAGLHDRVRLFAADATDFDSRKQFGVGGFDRIYFSYTLSMIPEWEKALHAGLNALNPGGSLHIIDFGTQAKLPESFSWLLKIWLAKFHVEPRNELQQVLRKLARKHKMQLDHRPLYRAYAQYAVLHNRD